MVTKKTKKKSLKSKKKVSKQKSSKRKTHTRSKSKKNKPRSQSSSQKQKSSFPTILILLLAVVVILVFSLDIIFPTPSATESLERYKNFVPNNSSEREGTNPNAELVIEEFSDFECPYCLQASFTVKKVLAEQGHRVNFKFRHLPLQQVHKNALKAAEASECARDQGMFWEMHDKLFENQHLLRIQDLKLYADQLGLDMPTFNDCLLKNEKLAVVQDDVRLALELGIRGTPTFFIGTKRLEGIPPYELFVQHIDEEIAKLEGESAE